MAAMSAVYARLSRCSMVVAKNCKGVLVRCSSASSSGADSATALGDSGSNSAKISSVANPIELKCRKLPTPRQHAEIRAPTTQT
jgi:hypothetical protein